MKRSEDEGEQMGKSSKEITDAIVSKAMAKIRNRSMTTETTERKEADRPGLYLCCMRTAERYYDSNARYGIEIGFVITCGNPKCKQPVKYIGGGWKHADAK